LQGITSPAIEAFARSDAAVEGIVDFGQVLDQLALDCADVSLRGRRGNGANGSSTASIERRRRLSRAMLGSPRPTWRDA
jgi:hypothetical protein